MKRIIVIAVVAILIAAGVVWAITRNSSSENDGRLSVAASYYPLYEFAKQVGDDKVSVTNLTPAGADPHDYELPARELARAQDANVFVYNGADFEPWADAFLADYRGAAVNASTNIELREGSHGHDDDDDDEDEEEEFDPHFWLDPVLAQRIVDNIRDGLIEADPGNREHYTRNAAAYNQQLAQLDGEFETGLAACNLDVIITAHDAFSYVAHRYGFEVEAIAGLSHDAEPSPARLAELTRHVREEGVQYIFFEHLASPRLADTIARETGAETLVLDPIEGPDGDDHEEDEDYVSIQRQNLANLQRALACD